MRLFCIGVPVTTHLLSVSSLPAALLEGKIVVDVSNRATVRRTSELSQAEQLARLLPGSKVVKSFNVLSAYSLGESRLQN